MNVSNKGLMSFLSSSKSSHTPSMLIDTVRDFNRHSWNSAQTRNWYVAGIADEVYMTPFDNNSMLSPMHYSLTHYGNAPVIIL